MASRVVRAAVAALAMIMLTGACQLTVGIDTEVDASGKGTVALRMAMDEELLTTARADAAEMRAFESLFETLGASGWRISKDTEGGGLEMRAETDFQGVEEYASTIARLQEVVSSRSSTLVGDMRFDLGLKIRKGLFQTRTSFEGTLDTVGGVRLDPHLLQAVEDLVRFEVSASLPGQTHLSRGEASAEDGTLVWRPSLGDEMSFAANAEALRMGPMFAALFALLSLIAGAVGSLVSRRRKATAARPLRVVPTPDPIVLDPVTAPGLPLPDRQLVLDAKPIDVEALLRATPEFDEVESRG